MTRDRSFSDNCEDTHSSYYLTKSYSCDMRACVQFPGIFKNRTLFWEVMGDKSESGDVLFFNRLNAVSFHFHHVAYILIYSNLKKYPGRVKASTDDRLTLPPTSRHMRISLSDLIPGCKCNFIKCRLCCVCSGHKLDLSHNSTLIQKACWR